MDIQLIVSGWCKVHVAGRFVLGSIAYPVLLARRPLQYSRKQLGNDMRRLKHSVKKEDLPVLLRRFGLLQLPLAHASPFAVEGEAAYFTCPLGSY